MHLKIFSSLLVLFSIVLLSTSITVLAQEAILTIDVSEQTYNEGETIVISGNVAAVIPNTPVIIQIIYGEGNIIDVAQIIPAENGRFTHSLIAQGPLWKNDGEYIARAAYGTGEIAEANFDFLTTKNSTEIEENYEVKIPDSTSTFDVEYTIRGGTVQDMFIDTETLALTTEIESTGKGTLTIELPRDSIDAKTSGCEGDDEIYIIRIDDVQVPYEEINTTNSNRVISIQFEEGDKDIEIIGTCVIPEFGSIAALILAASIVSVIALSRKNMIKI